MNLLDCSRGQKFGIQISTSSFLIINVLKGSECNPDVPQTTGLEYTVAILWGYFYTTCINGVY